MSIILEGPDAAGKTTVGKALAKAFNMSLFLTGSAPKSYDEMVRMCQEHVEFAKRSNLIIDRVTPISHPVYNRSVADDPHIISARKAIISVPNCVIVFCRPPNEVLMDERYHEWKDYDTPEHIEKILDNCHLFIQRYDEDMATIPHIKFDWTTQSIDELIKRMNNEADWNAVLSS